MRGLEIFFIANLYAQKHAIEGITATTKQVDKDVINMFDKNR